MMDISAVISVVLSALRWLARKEKLRIRLNGIDYKFNISKQNITVYCGCEFLRSGGEEIRYIKGIILRPDKRLYGNLQQYFSLPSSGEMTIDKRTELPKNKIVPLFKGELAVDPEYRAIGRITDVEQQRIQTIASELGQSIQKVGMVWEDTEKSVWKTVSKRNMGQWI